MNIRTIGKFCFLLVIFGFFMPITCDLNGFQLANSDFVKPELTFALYLLFFSAIAGLIIGVALIMKKKVPVAVDWLIIIVCMYCGIIPIFVGNNRNEYKFQSGLYVIYIGYGVILLAQIISFLTGEGSEATNDINVNSTAETTMNVKDKKRHGFTSFWLILSLIISVYVLIGFFLSVLNLQNDYNGFGGLTKFFIIILGIFLLAVTIGIVLLLRWKKIGIWIFIGLSAGSLLLTIALVMNLRGPSEIGPSEMGLMRLMPFMPFLIVYILSVLIMWGVLHIRKNGKTTWEQLE